MKEDIKVSVLIPVYNVEKYIERCARSLFRQTMGKGIEFIFTDDASEDRSIEILKNVLEEFPERKHQTILLHHEKNLGLAATRKTGFRVAKGKYIIHCDSDDWVEPDMYEQMYAEAKRIDADLVGCDFIYEFDGSSVIQTQSFDLSPTDQLSRILQGVDKTTLEVMVWNRMIRSSLYKKFGLITPDINKSEDLPVTVAAHCYAKKIGYVSRPLYHYNKSNSNSIMNVLGADYHPDEELAGDFIKGEIEKTYSNDEEIKRALYIRLLSIKRNFLRRPKSFNPDKFRKLWPDVPVVSGLQIKTKILYWLAYHKFDGTLKFLTRIEKV